MSWKYIRIDSSLYFNFQLQINNWFIISNIRSPAFLCLVILRIDTMASNSALIFLSCLAPQMFFSPRASKHTEARADWLVSSWPTSSLTTSSGVHSGHNLGVPSSYHTQGQEKKAWLRSSVSNSHSWHSPGPAWPATASTPSPRSWPAAATATSWSGSAATQKEGRKETI